MPGYAGRSLCVFPAKDAPSTLSLEKCGTFSFLPKSAGREAPGPCTKPVSPILKKVRTQTFTYDALNRVKTGQSSGTDNNSWGEDYSTGIDAWGNLTTINSISGKVNHEGLNCGPAATNNQLTTCYSYDAAGNLISNSPSTYKYDAENRLTTTGGYTYYYDGDGNRVAKVNGSISTAYWRGPTGDPFSKAA